MTVRNYVRDWLRLPTYLESIEDARAGFERVVLDELAKIKLELEDLKNEQATNQLYFQAEAKRLGDSLTAVREELELLKPKTRKPPAKKPATKETIEIQKGGWRKVSDSKEAYDDWTGETIRADQEPFITGAVDK